MTTKRDDTVVDFTAPAKADARAAWRSSEPRLPLFSRTVDDDGSAHVETVTIPSKANAGLALEFLRMSRAIGVELSISWLIEETVGADGYTALVEELESYDGDPQALLGGIGEKIQRVVMGGLDNPKA